MDIGEIGLLGAVTVFMVLIVVLLNKRIDDMRADFKDDISGVQSDMKVIQDGQKELQEGQKALQDGQVRLIASVAWLMARTGATPDEVARLYQDPQSGAD